MEKFTHTVTAAQFITASDTWHEIMNRNREQRGFAYFDVFLGRKEYSNSFDAGWNQDNISGIKCTERAYNKIEMLNSPHARTLLKAFKAKYGYHKDIP